MLNLSRPSAGPDKPSGEEQRDEAGGESEHHEDAQRADGEDLSAEERDQPKLARHRQRDKDKDRCKTLLFVISNAWHHYGFENLTEELGL